MKLLTEVENEMPIGNRELPMGEMKTKDVANPNKGKWRVVNADTNKPFDASKFYDTKEEAQAAVEKLGRTKGSGVKIMQLKDTMKVYTKESISNPTPEQMDILRAIQDMVMAGDDTILDLIKDKMDAEWGDEPESGRSGPWSQNYNDTDDMENMNINEAPDWVVGHSYQDGVAKKVVKMGSDKVRVTFDTGETITYQIARDNPENWVQIS
jgi:hypothetical protein